MSHAGRERSPTVTTTGPTAPVSAAETGTAPPAQDSSPAPSPSPATAAAAAAAAVAASPQMGSETTNPRGRQPSASEAGQETGIRSEHPPPPFEPLFTLLTNSTTNATIHPRVHYVFSDDDPGVLANAAANPSQRALVVDLVPSARQQQQQQQKPRAGSDTTTTANAAATTAVDSEGPGSSPWSIAWASSLSPDFAVTGSELAVQQHGGEGGGALMLRVEGVEREPVDAGPGGDPTASTGGGGGGSGSGSSGNLRNSASGQVAGTEDVDGLLDDFRRRMDLLRKVVSENERRREAQGRQAQDQEEQQQPPPQPPHHEPQPQEQQQ